MHKHIFTQQYKQDTTKPNTDKIITIGKKVVWRTYNNKCQQTAETQTAIQTYKMENVGNWQQNVHKSRSMLPHAVPCLATFAAPCKTAIVARDLT